MNHVAYPKYSNNDHENVLKPMPFTIITNLKHDKFSSSERIHGLVVICQLLKNNTQGLIVGIKFTCKTMVAIMAQKKLFHILLFEKVEVISSNANNTPPTGEPKATATPAALEAVSISRISAVEKKGHMSITLVITC